MIHEKTEVDIIAVTGDISYGIKIKFFSKLSNPSIAQLEKAINKIKVYSFQNKLIPVVVISCVIKDETRGYFKKICPEVEIVDIANILYAIQEESELRNELISVLPYAVEDVQPIKGNITLNWLSQNSTTESLIREMELCQSGRRNFRTYEEICYKLLQNVFSDDLALWKQQQRSNNDLYRFDLICRIKDRNEKTFWTILEQYFLSKYVIFEFKNYKEPISQKEIYTTEKYLYTKALRGTGIIISANGYSNNAMLAAKGCLRESGKLIILLDTNDLIKMMLGSKAPP